MPATPPEPKPGTRHALEPERAPREPSTPQALLEELGLTVYQRKAYLGLLGLGDASARQIVQASGVPQPKIYAVLQELKQKGLIETLLGPPSRFRPVPLQAFLHGYVSDMRGRAEQFERTAQRIGEEIARLSGPSVADAGQVTALHGWRNVQAHAHELATAARRSLQVLSPEESSRVFSRGLTDLLRERAAAGVRVSVLLPVTVANLEDVKRLARHVEIRHHPQSADVFAMLRDGEGALLGQPRTPRSGSERALVLADPVLLQFVEQAFRALWEAAVPLAERMAELEHRRTRFLRLLATPEATLEAIRTTVDEAKTDLLCLTTERGAFQWLALRSELERARQRGVRIRFLLPATPANRNASMSLEALGEVRSVAPGDARFVIADGRRLLLLDPPASGDSPFLDSSAVGPHNLQAEHPTLAALLGEYFDLQWERARAPTG